MLTISKQPREETTFAVDFSHLREIRAGEVIVSAEVEASHNAVPTPSVLVGHTISGKSVQVRVREGVHATTYKITIRITTDAAHVREADVFMVVEEV